MQKYNISKPEEYTNKQGEIKTMWHNIGTMTEFDNGSRIIEIPAINLKASIFKIERKEQKVKPLSSGYMEQEPLENLEEYIQAEDLPF